MANKQLVEKIMEVMRHNLSMDGDYWIEPVLCDGETAIVRQKEVWSDTIHERWLHNGGFDTVIEMRNGYKKCIYSVVFNDSYGLIIHMDSGFGVEFMTRFTNNPNTDALEGEAQLAISYLEGCLDYYLKREQGVFRCEFLDDINEKESNTTLPNNKWVE